MAHSENLLREEIEKEVQSIPCKEDSICNDLGIGKTKQGISEKLQEDLKVRGTDIEHDKDKHARKARPCGDMSTLASLSCVPTCSFDGKDNTPSTGYKCQKP